MVRKSDFARKTREFGRDPVARGSSGLKSPRRRAPVVPPNSGEKSINKVREAGKVINKGHQAQWRLTLQCHTWLSYLSPVFLCLNTGGQTEDNAVTRSFPRTDIIFFPHRQHFYPHRHLSSPAPTPIFFLPHRHPVLPAPMSTSNRTDIFFYPHRHHFLPAPTSFTRTDITLPAPTSFFTRTDITFSPALTSLFLDRTDLTRTDINPDRESPRISSNQLVAGRK